MQRVVRERDSGWARQHRAIKEGREEDDKVGEGGLRSFCRGKLFVSFSSLSLSSFIIVLFSHLSLRN